MKPSMSRRKTHRRRDAIVHELGERVGLHAVREEGRFELASRSVTASTPGREPEQVHRRDAPGSPNGFRACCDVVIPAISNGMVSRSTPITVNRVVVPVTGSRTSTGTGANVGSSA